MARSQPVTSLLILTVAGAVCAATLATAGRTVASQRAALDALGDVQARTIEVRSVGSPAVDPGLLGHVERMDTVVVAVGLSQAFALHPPELRSVQVPAITVWGTLSGLPAPGPSDGAYVSRTSIERAGLESAAGVLHATDGRALTVRGWFTSPPPLDQLEDFVVVRGPAMSEHLDRVVVVVGEVGAVEPVASAINALHLSDDRTGVTVQTPEALLHARRTLQEEFTTYGRSMVLAFEAAGTMSIALLVFAATLARRRDYGRRRALGASRPALIGLVLGYTVLPAVLGVAGGTIAGTAWLVQTAGASAGWRYPLAVAALTLLSAASAALAPSVVAAWRDPVTVLRTP